MKLAVTEPEIGTPTLSVNPPSDTAPKAVLNNEHVAVRSQFGNLAVLKRQCRHGVMSFFEQDEYVGRSFKEYGEYVEAEFTAINKLLKPGNNVVEVGANIGAFTVPMAKAVGPEGLVVAYEPQWQSHELLYRNVRDNDLLDCTRTYDRAVSKRKYRTTIADLEKLGHDNFGRVELSSEGRGVNVIRLDDEELLKALDKLRLIKIDAEGHELSVLRGAEELIEKHRPVLYVESDREDKHAKLLGWIIDHNYRCYWHCPWLFNPDNFDKNENNVFFNTVSANVLCVPEEYGTCIDGMDEISDPRIDPDMHERELKRTLRLMEKSPGDVELRFKAAHFANLCGMEKAPRKLIADNLTLDPAHAGTLALQGLLDLQAGDFEKGWPAYELRYKMKKPESFGYRAHDVPHWDGKPTDQVVKIWCEQGFGDSIMFVRFMRDVLALAPNAILEVQPQLYELFEISGIMPQGQLFRYCRRMPKFMMHCSLPSVPATIGLSNESQVKSDPYLIADPEMVASWRRTHTKLRIGVCLNGGAASERAYSRDLDPSLMEPLAEKFGPFLSLANNGQWESFADTASAIEALDLVITVDTSVAHLAGAMGVPTWLMLSFDPDWRWQRNRTSSPWYPSMHIFRQKIFMDWSNVLEDISKELESRRACKPQGG